MSKPEPVKVIFRMWGSSVIALFPEIDADRNPHHCLSYEHVGQHGGADYTGIIAKSRPAKPKEYADLRRELIRQGYRRLQVRQRATRPMAEKRFRAIAFPPKPVQQIALKTRKAKAPGA